MIKAEIVADSLSPQGDRLISVLATFPRIILAEVNTHRMLSKNTASSRAIPTPKMLQSLEEYPFIPIAWQKEHKGMQGTEYITDPVEIQREIDDWLEDRDYAVSKAKKRLERKVTKQISNRPLESFMWTTMLITGSQEGWDNFFDLRCPQYQTPVSQTIEPQRSWKDLMDNHSNPINEKILGDNKDNILFKLQHNKGQAEIHMMALAECIYDAVNESIPKQLKDGEWHIPFEDRINLLEIDLPGKQGTAFRWNMQKNTQIPLNVLVSTAMAARTSYTVVGDEREFGYDKQIKLHDELISRKPLHASPMEHCARAMSDKQYHITYGTKAENSKGNGWCRNYKGFIQYRHILET